MIYSLLSHIFYRNARGFVKKSWQFLTISILFTPIVFVLTLHPEITFSLPSGEIGIITANKLNMRSEAEMTAPPMMMLKQGTEVKIIEREGQWLKIECEGQVGYIQNNQQHVHIISIKTKGARENFKENTSDRDLKIEQYKKEAEAIESKIEEEETKLKIITKEEVNVFGSLNQLDLSLDKTRRHILANKAKLDALEEKIAKTTEQYKHLIKEIAINEDYASQRLVALYKLTWLGKMNLLASARSMHEFFQRKKNLETILAHDERIRKKLLADKASLKEVLDRLNAQQLKKRKLQENIEKQFKEVSHKRSERAELLEKIRSERALQIASLESLKQAAVALDQTIASLMAELNSAAQTKNLNILSFSELKGLLKKPVKGKIISLFGPYKNPKFNVTNFRSGIDIKAEKGAQVQAVYAGQVLYANWFKGYGNMIIIDHGDSYYTVYAHLEDLLKAKGDYVNAGEDIATVGDTGSLIGPKLYFEVRHHGKPLDPLNWVIKG